MPDEANTQQQGDNPTQALLQKLQAELEAAKTELTGLKTAQQKVVEEGRKPKSKPVPQGLGSKKPEERMQALEEFANNTAAELELYKVANEFGLKVEDLTDLEYNNPTELRLAARAVQLDKKAQALEQSQSTVRAELDKLRQAQEGRRQSSDDDQEEDDRPDTGGRTGGKRKGVDQAKVLYDKVTKLPQGTREARYTMLEALRRDPEKWYQVASPSDEE